MTAASMKAHLLIFVCATAITGVSLIGNLMMIGFDSPGRRLAFMASLPSLPAQVIIAILGLGHGPDGLPTNGDVVLYVLTFALWWGALLLARRWQGRQTATIP